MKERSVGIAALCLILLTIPLALSSGLVNTLAFTKRTTGFVQQAEDTPTISVEPRRTTGNYEWDVGFNVSDTFEVSITVSSVVDLYTWNANLTWNPTVLSFTGIVSYGDFLAQTASPYGTTSNITDVILASNEMGYAAVAESILGSYSGITGSGRLVTVEFLILDYGSTALNVSLGGNLPTELLDSTGISIEFTTKDGYFSNIAPSGDVNGDGIVNVLDLTIVSLAYGTYEGEPGYNPDADLNADGIVEMRDLVIVARNLMKTKL